MKKSKPTQVQNPDPQPATGKARTLKLGLDVHADNYVVVRIVDAICAKSFVTGAGLEAG